MGVLETKIRPIEHPNTNPRENLIKFVVSLNPYLDDITSINNIKDEINNIMISSVDLSLPLLIFKLNRIKTIDITNPI